MGSIRNDERKAYKSGLFSFKKYLKYIIYFLKSTQHWYYLSVKIFFQPAILKMLFKK